VASCPWRIEYEGAPYLVFSRGNSYQRIFISDDDRYLFFDTVDQMSERFEMVIFTYVLMDNHYHLLLHTPKANLSKSMKWLGIRKKLALEPKFQKRIAVLKSQIRP
jgi:REP element-mobilizing transposase RayT